MAAKRSRSEIEEALASQVARKSKRRKSKPSLDEQPSLATPSRRRQVIGGDFSGISRRARNSKSWNRYREFNAANWIAGGIVVAILAVFFWPQPSNDVVEEVSQLTEQTGPSAYQDVARIDEQVPAEPISTFSRDNDLDRAAEFRQQDELERKIRQLVAQAKAHIDKGQYSLPEGRNAVTSYKQILELDPRNVDARQGLDYVNGRFLESGISALNEDKEELAKVNLSKLAAIDAESAEYRELNERLDTWRKNKQIDAVLAKANEAIRANRLILPARENALYFYQQALAIDDDNAAARKGVKRITDNFIDQANQAMISGDYQAASGYLATVSVIDPDHPSIPLLEAVISKAKPLAEQSQQSQAAQTNNRNQQVNSRQTTQNQPRSTKTTASNTRRSPRASNAKTPGKEAREQEAFDRQYLQRGLNAYYQGDYQTAAALLQPLADKGVSRAQLRIGYMFYQGRGFEEDKQEADRIIRAALPAVRQFAEEGRAWAQADIGSLYEDGLVLPKDYGEAVFWYRSAAQQGYAGAQTNLGVMYARGRGVATNRKTAIEWLQRAAKQGDALAQRNLEALGVKP